MLGSLRKFSKSWSSRIVIIVLALSFGLWGIGDVFRGGTEGTVATVGDVEISNARFSSQFRRQLQRLQRSNPSITQEQAHQMGLTRQVLGGLISDALYQQEAEELGFEVADTLVRSAIVDQGTFVDESGNFDRERYELTLQRNNLTPEGYEALVRKDLRAAELRQTVSGDHAAPRALADALYRFNEERRNAVIAIIPRGNAADIGEPSEADLEAYYEAHAAQFTAPEYRTAAFVELTPEAVAGEIELSDEDIYAEYETRLESYRLPDQRAVAQILSTDEALIRDGRRMLDEGQSFQEVADALSKRGATSLKMGSIGRGALPQSAADIVFGLEVGEISTPVRTPLGWHLFQVEDVMAARTQSFNEVSEALREEMSLDLAADSLFRLSTVLEDELAGGASLEQAADAIGIDTRLLPAIDRDGKDKAGARSLVDIAERDEVVTAMFEAEEGVESALSETEDGSYFILRVDTIEPPSLKPLETVRQDVVSAWRREAEIDATQRAAERVSDRVKGGETLERAAKSAGYDVVEVAGLLRHQSPVERGVSRQLIAGLFAQNTSAPEPVVAEIDEGFAVAMLTDVGDADPASDEESVEALRIQLARQRADDIGAVYRLALQNRHAISVNTRAIDALFETP